MKNAPWILGQESVCHLVVPRKYNSSSKNLTKPSLIQSLFLKFVFFRGGRFINNVFVPSGAVAPREVRVRATFGGDSGVGSSASVDSQGRSAWTRLGGEGEQEGGGWAAKFNSENAERPLRRSGR